MLLLSWVRTKNYMEVKQMEVYNINDLGEEINCYLEEIRLNITKIRGDILNAESFPPLQLNNKEYLFFYLSCESEGYEFLMETDNLHRSQPKAYIICCNSFIEIPINLYLKELKRQQALEKLNRNGNFNREYWVEYSKQNCEIDSDLATFKNVLYTNLDKEVFAKGEKAKFYCSYLIYCTSIKKYRTSRIELGLESSKILTKSI